MAKKKKSDECRTQALILEAACELFPRLGYRATSVQKICDLAGATIAAVNYHFKGKMSLYEAVWELLVESSEFMVMESALSVEQAEGALRVGVRARVQAVCDQGPGGRLPRLFQHEMRDASPIQVVVVLRFMMPVFKQIISVLRSYMGAGAADDDLQRALMLYLSPVVFLNVVREGESGMPEFFGASATSPQDEQKRLFKMMESYIMGGLAALRDEFQGEVVGT